MSGSIDWSRVPLLSGKPLCDWTPEEYREYVIALYHKHEPRKSAKRTLQPFRAKTNAKGTLLLRINRDPKWLSEPEMLEISKETGVPLNLIFIKMKKLGAVISTEREMKRITEEIKSLPW